MPTVRCPRCRRMATASRGQVLVCEGCGQRLSVPSRSPSPRPASAPAHADLLLEQVLSTELAFGCSHQDAAVLQVRSGTWDCRIGFRHQGADTVLAGPELQACLEALGDYRATGHPSSLAYYRSTYAALVNADAQWRHQAARYLAELAEHQRRASRTHTQAFLEGFLGRPVV